MDQLSASCHSTSPDSVWQIVAGGLVPQSELAENLNRSRDPQWRGRGRGQGKGKGDRKVICMSAFLPWDDRYVKGARVDDSTYTIIFNHTAISELRADDPDFCYLTVAQKRCGMHLQNFPKVH